MLKAIVCVSYDENNKLNPYSWGIGKKNGLLFNIKKDMEWFKEKTDGQIVVCGYNTLLSFPGGKPLKNRKTIVICPEGIEPEGCTVFHNGTECRKYVQELAKTEDVWIIGGAMVYSTFCYYCEEIYVTKVYSIDKEATAFFPNLDKNDIKKCVWESDLYEEDGYKFKFTLYKHVHLTDHFDVTLDNVNLFEKYL